MCINRNASTERSAKQRVFWVIMAIGLKAGSLTKASGGTSPLMRILLPVIVSPCARVSISLIKADFPEPVGSTIDRVSPGLISILSNPSCSPSLFFPDLMVRSRCEIT